LIGRNAHAQLNCRYIGWTGGGVGCEVAALTNAQGQE